MSNSRCSKKMQCLCDWTLHPLSSGLLEKLILKPPLLLGLATLRFRSKATDKYKCYRVLVEKPSILFEFHRGTICQNLSGALRHVAGGIADIDDRIGT